MCERKELFFKRPLPFFTLLPIIDPMINIMPELTPVFTAYEALVAEADAVFARVGEMHPDCEFLTFTNGTLIDEAFCQEMLRVKKRPCSL